MHEGVNAHDRRSPEAIVVEEITERKSEGHGSERGVRPEALITESTGGPYRASGLVQLWIIWFPPMTHKLPEGQPKTPGDKRHESHEK